MDARVVLRGRDARGRDGVRLPSGDFDYRDQDTVTRYATLYVHYLNVLMPALVGCANGDIHLVSSSVTPVSPRSASPDTLTASTAHVTCRRDMRSLELARFARTASAGAGAARGACPGPARRAGVA